MQASISAVYYSHSDSQHSRDIRKYAWIVAIGWTMLLLVSSCWTVAGLRKTLNRVALAQARATIERDTLYRSWGASHGGVYVPITQTTPPNPSLSHLPDRDISTPSGVRLTMVNPAYMTRQVYELSSQGDANVGRGHLTSLKPLRPENVPDPWEEKALHGFEAGLKEVYEITEIEGHSYMRLMRPFVTKKPCLKCHAVQGYKEGDIRGGLSVSVMLQPLMDVTESQTIDSLSINGLIWLIGLGISGVGARKLSRGAREQKRAEIELHEQALQLEEEIAERQRVQESLQVSEQQLQDRNDELLVTEEMLRTQIDEYQTSRNLLKESNQSLQTLFDVAPLSIVISSDPEGVIRKVNRTFIDDFGYLHDMSIGKTGLELGLWCDPGERQRFMTILHEQQGVSGFSAEIRTFQGKKHNVLLYGKFVNYREERCILTVFMDVTEQKLMEDQLRQTQKMDVIGQLAGGVAHDFNNMLTAIAGSAELMERYVTQDPAPMKLLGSIREAAARSADLTQQLLIFSRKGHKHFVQVSINETINAVISLLERTVDKKISLEARLGAHNALVTGDQTFLQNALLNLGINARDAMPEGGVITFATANVELDTPTCMSYVFNVPPGQYLEIAVSDTGMGMTREVVERIFEPFFTTKGVGKGTGLGLAAVYTTVKEHHGSIDVCSEIGVGTVFRLYLPLSVGEKTVSPVSAEIARGGGGILLVDDEPLLRNVGCELLQNSGYRVFLAEDGEQALEVYAREKEQISLVILDMVMPNMGGKETLERLMEGYPGVRVLISSGFHQGGAVETLMNLGAKGFLQKPYSGAELCTAVADAVGYQRGK